MYNFFLERLDNKKLTVKNKMNDIVEELFGNLLTEFNGLAQTKLENESMADGTEGTDGQQQSSGKGLSTQAPRVGNCIDDINNKIHFMLLATYEEAFTDYEQSLEYAKVARIAVNGEPAFEVTPAKRRKRKKEMEKDDRA